MFSPSGIAILVHEKEGSNLTWLREFTVSQFQKFCVIERDSAGGLGHHSRYQREDLR